MVALAAISASIGNIDALVNEIQPSVAALKARGINKIILLTHQGYAEDVAMARACVSEAGLLISACDVGGDGHRVLRFDLLSGEVWVRRGATMPKAFSKEMEQ